MSYFGGLGADTTGWTLRADGVVIPTDAETLAVFQTLQREINAILAKIGQSLIAVDGRIGWGTIAALRLITSKYSVPKAGATSPSWVAFNAIPTIKELGTLMGTLGAGFVADPSSSKPSTVKPDGTIDNPPDGLSTTTIAIVAIALGATVALLSRRRRR
jgi:lysozyme family protein